MSSPSRTPSTPAPRRARRVSTAAVVSVVLCLGGAVAAVYGTGVVLGSRIAPSHDADLPAGAAGTTPGGGGGLGAADAAPGPGGVAPGSSLPDRVERRPPAPTTGAPDAGRAPTEGDGPDVDADLGPYRGVWPYATWAEVRDHVDRGDPAFATPEDTARRFAQEVVGVPDPRLGTQRVARDDALIEVRTADGTTTVALTRPDLGPEVDAPWGVVSASGDLDLSAGPAGPGRVDAQVRGAGPAVVAVDDRVGWRGVARTVDGAASVRVEPGAAGPAAVVAIGGDPRRPSSFAVQAVSVGPGSATPDPPEAASDAAADLAAGLAAGDVTGVWNGLDDAAQSATVDWRGLVAGWEALAARVAPLAGDGVAVTRTAGTGPLDVLSASTPDGGATASVFRPTDRGSVLVSTGAPSVRWDVSAGSPATLTARGPTRPSSVVVDGRVRSGSPVGDDGLAVALTDLPSGTHVAVAVVGDGAAAATVVTTAEVAVAAPDPADPGPTPPPTTVPPTSAPAPTGPSAGTTTTRPSQPTTTQPTPSTSAP